MADNLLMTGGEYKNSSTKRETSLNAPQFRLNFVKTRDVKSPSRAHIGDAGMDFYVPNTQTLIVLKHGESCIIPSGIIMEVPFGYRLTFCNKSGVASKKNIHKGAEVVDHGYLGEFFFNMINNGDKEQTIKPGDKIIQGILEKVELFSIDEVSSVENLYTSLPLYGERGEGALGSTNHK